MESQHTPGPWSADRVLIDNSPDHMMVRVARWGGENVADCGTFAECNPSDARLIAAAPDMYEDTRWCAEIAAERAANDPNPAIRERYAEIAAHARATLARIDA